MTTFDLENRAAEAARRLRAGGLAVFPTETLAGVGCDPRLPAALARVGELKRRPPGQPYPLLVRDLAVAATLAEIPETAERLARSLWPGKLTLVLPALPDVPESWTADDGTLALRSDGHPVTQALLTELDGPLVATSANFSGQPAPRTVAEVDPALAAAVEVVIDGPPDPTGQGSTLVRVRRDGAWEILREGAVSTEQVAAALEVTE